jgi:cell division protein FtsB
MRALIVILLLLVVSLQYKLWLSDVGHVGAQRLQAQLDAEARRAEQLETRNRRLMAEVVALRNGPEDGYIAVEARARMDLGMIRAGEIFYLVPDRR